MSGLDYAWNRYYSGTWGRFTSADPYVMSGGLGNPQGWNRYSYVENDPVNFLDYSGLVKECPRGDGCRGDSPTPSTGKGETGGDVDGMEVTNDGQLDGGPTSTSLSSGQAAVDTFTPAAGNLFAMRYLPVPGPCQKRMDDLSEMSQGRITLESIISIAGKVVAYDGTDQSGLAGQMDLNELFSNSPNYVSGTMKGFTVAQYFSKNPGTSAYTMLGTNSLGYALMFIRPDEINKRSVAANAALVMHEALHSLGFEDPDLKKALNIKQSLGSIEITRAFAKDCFGAQY